MEKICGIYRITNTITGDFYIGSSKNVKKRWADHKCKSKWKQHPNNPMYQDMQNYGIEKFEFEILAEVEEDSLKEMEQQFIEKLQPTYNNRRANGWDVERRKETQKKAQKDYRKSDKCKEYQKDYQKEYRKTDKCKAYNKEYNNQLCCYNGEILTLCALSKRFQRAGIPHPQIEAKKYLLNNIKDKEYHKTEKFKEHKKEYQKSDKYKEYQKEFYKEYNNQLCSYNGELLTLCALSKRFQRAGIPHPQIEAKKYLLNNIKDK